MKIASAWWAQIRDYFVLTGLLVAANMLLAKTDMGWRGLNPTPWILPGILMGARYGFAAGLSGGLLSAALALALSGSSATSLRDLVEQNAYYLFSLAATGAVAGELRDLVWKRSSTLAQTNADLAEENAALKTQLRIAQEAKHQIQRRLAIYNAPLASLDEELAALFELPAEGFAEGLLKLLHRLTGLASAAFYEVKGSGLEQIAVLHPTSVLPQRLPLSTTPLAERALEEGQVASVVSVTALSREQPYLAAVPWREGGAHAGVLLIHDMPMEDFTLAHLARIEWILSWAGLLLEKQASFAGPAPQDHQPDPEAFRHLLAKAFQAEQLHGLPSMVLKLTSPDPQKVAPLLPRLPKTAIPAALPQGRGWAVLLPFAGESEALRIEAMLEGGPPLTCEGYRVAEPATPELLWQQLAEPKELAA